MNKLKIINGSIQLEISDILENISSESTRGVFKEGIY